MNKKADKKNVPDAEVPGTAAPETALVLRTVTADMKCCKGDPSHKPFTWPESGPVEAPDWDPAPRCGGGLHGLLEGEGEWDRLDWGITARALVLRVERGLLVDLGGKVKFPRAIVESVGSLASALCRLLCDPARVGTWIAEVLKAASGDASKLAASGYASQLAASGDDSQLAASGNDSQLAASGNDSKLAASGNASKLAASGYASKLAASGYASKLAASGYASQLAASGNASKLAASGNASKLAASGNASQLAASGDDSKLAASGNASKLAASGYASKLAASGNASKLAASGNDSVVVSAGFGAIASAGPNGVIALAWWDGKRPRMVVGYVGEDGIEANVAYRLDIDGRFVRAEDRR